MIKVGSVSQNSQVFNKFIGYARFQVVAINPSQEEFEKLFNRKIENWKGYTSKKEDGTDTARILFVLKDTKPNSELPLIQMSFFLTRQSRKTQDQLKTQVIDKFGNTAWVTSTEYANQKIPMSNAGKPLGIIPPYIPCCMGQDKLVAFIKAWANVPNSLYWDDTTGSFVPKSNSELEACEVSLDHIKDYWTGDFSELTSMLKGKPEESLIEHTITAMLIVTEKTINGKTVQVQDVYDYVVPGWMSPKSIEKNFTRDHGRGRYAGAQYAFTDAFKVESNTIAPLNSQAPNELDTMLAGNQQPTSMASEEELPF